MERTYKINWLNIIFKVLLVAIVIGILFWLIPKTNNKAFKEEVFVNNINSMKAAAKDYFKGKKLPPKIGDSKVITLDKMEESKLLIPFTDYDEKKCDGTKSYAEVTKNSDTEYSLKVNLSCNNKEDYVLDSIESISVEVDEPVINDSTDSTENENNDQENNNTTTNTDENSNNENVVDSSDIEGDKDGNIYEFEYRKLISAGKTTYSCPVGYEKLGNKCYNITYGDKINATVLYFDDVDEVTDAKVNTTGSVEVTAEPNKELVETKDVCPEGYTLNNNVCIKYVDATIVPGSTSYTCDKGGKLEGDKCILTTTYNATPVNGAKVCSCTGSDVLSGERCIYTRASNKSTTPKKCTTSYGGWGNPTVVSSPTQLTTYTGTTTKLSFKDSSCDYKGCTYYYYKYTRKTYQNCTGGKTVESCSNGTTPQGGLCYYDSPASCYTPVTYKCNQGDTLQGTKCVRDDTYNAKVEESEVTYTCPEGYTLDGTTCYKTTEVEKEEVYKYTCPEGYVQTGEGENTKCTKTVAVSGEYYCEDNSATLVDDKCIKKKKGVIRGYECPVGYVKEGTMCIKKNVHCVYPTPTVIEEAKYEYTWSLKPQLDGWEKTGNKRIASQETIDQYTIK